MAPPRPSAGRAGKRGRPGRRCGIHYHVSAIQAGCSRRPSCHGQAIRPHRGKRPCPLSTRCPGFRFRSGGLRQRTRVTAGDNPGRKPGPLHPLEFAPSDTIRGRPRIASWRWTPLEAHASPRNRDSPRRRRPGPHSFGRVTPLQNTGLITGGSGRTGRRPGDCEFPTLEAERLHVFGGNPPTRPAHHAGVVPTLGAGPPPRRRCPHRGSASRATRCSSSSLASGGCAPGACAPTR